MQNHVVNDTLNTFASKQMQDPLLKDVLGVTSPYGLDSDIAISEEQISILEDAIQRYERLEDIRKFSALALNDIETITEEDIKRAVELENTVSIDNEQAVLNLIQNEGFLKDLESTDFTDILASFDPSDFDISDDLQA